MEYTLAASYMGGILLVVSALAMSWQQISSLVVRRRPVVFVASMSAAESCVPDVASATSVTWSPGHTAQFRIPDEYLFEPVSQTAWSSLATFGAECAANE